MLRQFFYFAVVFSLLSVLPAMGQYGESGLADHRFDTGRNWMPIVVFVSFAVSLVIAGLVAMYSKLPGLPRVGLAFSILFGLPMACGEMYLLLCLLLNKRDGFW